MASCYPKLPRTPSPDIRARLTETNKKTFTNTPGYWINLHMDSEPLWAKLEEDRLAINLRTLMEIVE